MEKFSFSKIKSYKTCPRQYYYSYVQNLEPIIKNIAFNIGSAVHGLLEHLYKGTFKLWNDIVSEVHSGKLNTDFLEMDKIDKEMILFMVSQYLKIYNSDIAEYEIVGIELPFQVQLEDCLFEGIFDGVFKDQYGQYWIHEIKTAKNLPTGLADLLVLDDQINYYCWAFEQIFGISPAGVLYSVLKKTVPSKPDKLKNGTLSKAKTQNTTYEVYLEAIKEHDLNPDDYTDFLDFLKSSSGGSNTREIVTKHDSEITNTGFEIKNVIKRIMKGNTFYRNPAAIWTGGCFCDYKYMCMYPNYDYSDFKLKEEREELEGINTLTKYNPITIEKN